jgi:hypothetical protein
MSNALAAGSLPQPQPQAPEAPQAAPEPPAAPPAPEAAPEAPEAPEETPEAPPDADVPPPTLAEAGIDPELLQKAIHKMAVVTSRLTTVLEKPTVTRSAIIQMMTEIVADDAMSPQTAATFLADIPEEPDDIREWAQRHSDKGHELLAQMAYAQHGSAQEEAAQAPEAAMPPPGMMPQ